VRESVCARVCVRVYIGRVGVFVLMAHWDPGVRALRRRRAFGKGEPRVTYFTVLVGVDISHELHDSLREEWGDDCAMLWVYAPDKVRKLVCVREPV